MKTREVWRILGDEVDFRDVALVVISLDSVLLLSHLVQIRVSRGFDGVTEGPIIVVTPAIIVGLIPLLVASCFGERRRAILYGCLTMLLAGVYLLFSPSWILQSGGFAR